MACAVVRPTRMQGPGAAYYPLAPEPSRVIFVAGLVCFALVGGALGGIVPRFAEVYESVDIPLPDSTRFLCSASAVFPYVSPLYVVIAALARAVSRFLFRKGHE